MAFVNFTNYKNNSAFNIFPECEAPRTFDTCASRCVRTCSDPYPMCTAECVGRCACPAAQPIEHDGECIAFKECPMKPGKQLFKFCAFGKQIA